MSKSLRTDFITLPDIYRESDPAVRRQQAIDYLKRMEEK